MIRRPPRSTLRPSSAASDVYKRQLLRCRLHSGDFTLPEYENTVKLSSPAISGNRLFVPQDRLGGSPICASSSTRRLSSFCPKLDSASVEFLPQARLGDCRVFAPSSSRRLSSFCPKLVSATVKFLSLNLTILLHYWKRYSSIYRSRNGEKYSSFMGNMLGHYGK